jgi:hypothetical protein
MPVPPPTFPSATAPPLGGFERVENVLLLDVEAVRVVEVAVVRFRDDRQQPRLLLLATLRVELDHRVAHQAHAGRIRQHDGTFEEAGFLDPGRAGHFPVAVERRPAREDRIGGRLAARQDRGDAGPDRAGADFERPVTRDEGRVADLDAGHVGDGVERARCTAEGDAQVAGARLRLRGYRRHRQMQHGQDSHDLEQRSDLHNALLSPQVRPSLSLSVWSWRPGDGAGERS